MTSHGASSQSSHGGDRTQGHREESRTSAWGPDDEGGIILGETVLPVQSIIKWRGMYIYYLERQIPESVCTYSKFKEGTTAHTFSHRRPGLWSQGTWVRESVPALLHRSG